jgi:type IV secretory pathway VirB10-like protein
MGVLVIAAVVLVPPARPGEQASPGTATPPAAQPSFLDQHASSEVGGREPSTTTGLAPEVQAALDSIAASGATGTAGRYGVDAPASIAIDPTPPPVSYAAPMASAAASRPPAPRDRRALAYEAALAAPVHRGARATAPDVGQDGDTDLALTPGEESDRWATASPPVSVTWSASSATGAAPAPPMPPRGRFQQFLTDAQRPSATAIRTSVTPAPGIHTVQAGAVVPAVLLTEVNSDLPGDVLAQVTRDVFDSQTQRTLLIPKGARLLGRYHDQVGLGQNRLLLAWTRVLLPDGRSITLPGMPAQDANGAGGVGGRVERHGRRVLGSAALLSLIGAGVQLSQPNGGYGPWGAPGPGQVVAGAAGQQLAQVMSQLMQQNMNVQPTIRIAQGTPFNVFLTADLTFPGAYADGEVTR